MNAKNGDKVIAGSTNDTQLVITDAPSGAVLNYTIEVISTVSGIQFSEGACTANTAARTATVGQKCVMSTVNGSLHFKASNSADYFFITTVN